MRIRTRRAWLPGDERPAHSALQWAGRFLFNQFFQTGDIPMKQIIATSKSLRQTLVAGFLFSKKAASGFAEEAVKIFVVAAIVGVMIWIGTVVNDMLQQSGSML
jgi:hypothetical protein